MTALQLRQKRAKIAADAALLIPKTGSISPEDKRKFDLMMFECESLKSEIDAAERSGAGGEDERSRLERLERELRETRRPRKRRSTVSTRPWTPRPHAATRGPSLPISVTD